MESIGFEVRSALRGLVRTPAYPAVNPEELVTILASSNEDCAERCPDLFSWDTYRAIEASQLGLSSVAPILTTPLASESADSTTVFTSAATVSALDPVKCLQAE